jgi:hypothetical protein
MAKEKNLYGLPDYLSLKHDEVAVYPEISKDYVPGIGFAPTDQAKRWAYMGYMVQETERFKRALAELKRKPQKSDTGGAPLKHEELKMENQRVFALWLLAQKYLKDFRLELTNRKAIQMARERWKIGTTKFAFGVVDATIEQSVSRGKAFWRVDKAWNSKRLEDYHSRLHGKNA